MFSTSLEDSLAKKWLTKRFLRWIYKYFTSMSKNQPKLWNGKKLSGLKSQKSFSQNSILELAPLTIKKFYLSEEWGFNLYKNQQTVISTSKKTIVSLLILMPLNLFKYVTTNASTMQAFFFLTLSIDLGKPSQFLMMNHSYRDLTMGSGR